MPQDQLQVKRTLSQIEEAKINALTMESESFVPINLELKENSAYVGKRGYDVDKTSEQVKFIDDLLGSVHEGTLTMNPEQKAFLIMQSSRYKSFMHLNDGKFSGDSKEMALVKTHLGDLEKILNMPVTFEDRTFNAIENQYDNVIKVCRHYVNNKNPWFSTGIARKQMVQDTLARMEEEKKTFLAAKEAYLKGYLGKESFATAEKLMEAHLAESFAQNDEKEAYDKKMAQEIEENEAWLNDLKQEKNFDNYFGLLKDQNPYITEEDALYHFLSDVSTKLQSFKDDTYGYIPPMMGNIWEAQDLVKLAKARGVAEKSDLSRKVTPGLQLVKRNIYGEPRNESERIKERENSEYLGFYRAYYDAKYTKNQAGDAPSEEVLNSFENAKKNLWDCCIKRIENIISKFRIPTPEEFKKNPYFMENLIHKDFGFYYELNGLAGWWSELGNEGFKNFEDAYLEQHPEFDMIMNMLVDIKMVETSYSRNMHHMNAKNKVEVKSDPLYRYMKVMNDEDATAQEKEDAEQEYKDSMEALEQERDDIIKGFIKHYDQYKKYEVLTTDEKKIYRALKVISKRKTPVQVVEEEREKGITVSQKAAEISLLLQNALKTDHLPEYAELQSKLHEQNKNGGMSREVGALLYLVLKDENNEPLDEEEKRKQEWNKKWIECYADENKKQEKKDLMREALPRIINTEIPSPDEIKANGWAYYFEKNPVKYVELSKRVSAISNLQQANPDIFLEIVPIGSDLSKRWLMLCKMASYISKFISMQYLLDEDNNYEFFKKAKYDTKVDPDYIREHKQYRVGAFILFENDYNDLKSDS